MSSAVYVMRDAHDVVLYVGMSSFIPDRMNSHRKGDGVPDWRRVASIDLEHFESRDAAGIRERALIAQYRPPWNLRGNPDAIEPKGRRGAEGRMWRREWHHGRGEYCHDPMCRRCNRRARDEVGYPTSFPQGASA